jgi:Flp pilus assembly secretin CpaC
MAALEISTRVVSVERAQTVIVALSSHTGEPVIGTLERTRSVRGDLKIRLDRAGGIAMAVAVLRMRIFVVVLILLLLPISVACAADQTITLRLGGPTALALERPFETVLVADPNIVDIHTINDRRVTLEPLNLGATSLIFVDSRNIAITNVRIVVLRPGEI